MGKMHSGGKKNLVMEYYKNIDRSKIQFDFICDVDSNAIPKKEIEELGGRVYEVTSYKRIIRNMIDISRICKANHYKIMHGYNGTMNVFAMLVGKLCGIPIRINESISMAHKDDKKTIIKNMLKPFSRSFATHYMANGEACGRWQFGDKLYEEGKVAVFKTVIDTGRYRFQPEIREKARKEYGLTDNFVVGHIGRLTAQKNTMFLLDIFHEIYQREPNAKMILIGDGDLIHETERKIWELGLKDAVLFLGRREDIGQFYHAMDCFLLPSLYEGLPVVGVEAETNGLPMFFSTEIARESSPCDDIGYFLDLSLSAEEWAEFVIKETKRHVPDRRDHSREVREAGFDSRHEGNKLFQYYQSLLNDLDQKQRRKASS